MWRKIKTTQRLTACAQSTRSSRDGQKAALRDLLAPLAHADIDNGDWRSAPIYVSSCFVKLMVLVELTYKQILFQAALRERRKDV